MLMLHVQTPHTPSVTPTPRDSHAVEELPVRLVPFALRHQAVQLVDQLGLHLQGGEEGVGRREGAASAKAARGPRNPFRIKAPV